jgi:hypothetical protein
LPVEPAVLTKSSSPADGRWTEWQCAIHALPSPGVELLREISLALNPRPSGLIGIASLGG